MFDEFAQQLDDSPAYIIALKQRAYTKIKTFRCKSVVEINHALIKVCGGNVLNRSTIQCWSQGFREGSINIEDNQRSGRLSIVTGDNSKGRYHRHIVGRRSANNGDRGRSRNWHI